MLKIQNRGNRTIRARPQAASARKLTRTVDTKETRMEFRDMKITYYQYLSKVFQFLQRKFGIKTGYATFGIEATKTNILIWVFFISSSLTAAIHLGLNHEENLETIDSTSRCWTRSTLAHDQVIRWTKAIVRVYSDSALCLGKMSRISEANT